MDQQHNTFQEDIPAYALGSLDPEESAALEAHLQTCESCRHELAAYQRVGSGLLAALPAHPPRAAVKRNLQKALAGQTEHSRPRRSWGLGQWAFAGVLAVLVGLNLLTVYQMYSLRREQAEMINRGSSEQTAIAMLAYPSTKTLTFNENGITGSLLVDKQRNLVALFAWNLATAPAGKTYQMWLIDPQGDRTSGGLLEIEPGYPFVMATIQSPQPLTNVVGLGVTVEPAGGSPKPTGPRVLRVDF